MKFNCCNQKKKKNHNNIEFENLESGEQKIVLLWWIPPPDININDNIGWRFSGDTIIYCTRHDNIKLVFDSCNIVIARAIYSCIPLKAIQYHINIVEGAIMSELRQHHSRWLVSFESSYTKTNQHSTLARFFKQN